MAKTSLILFCAGWRIVYWLVDKMLAGKTNVDQALKDSQAAVGRAVKQAGYQK
jgi:hypothetical protein